MNRRRASTRVRPTGFGILIVALLVGGAILRPAVADPSMAGLLWGGLLGVALLGIAWPLIGNRSLRVEVRSAPTDVVVGAPCHLELVVHRPTLGVVLGLTAEMGLLAASTADAGGSAVNLTMTVNRRDVYTQLPVTAVVDGPFSMLSVRRLMPVTLLRPMYVGPEPIATTAPVGEIDASDGLAPGSGPRSAGDTVRSVRPYVTGDPAHLVHWPSSARSGELVVLELEPPPALGLAIVVDLGASEVNGGSTQASGPGAIHGSADSRAPVEVAASRAAGAACWALGEGAAVILCTNANGQPRTERVETATAVERCLAAATPGTPGVAPHGWPTMRINPGDGT